MFIKNCFFIAVISSLGLGFRAQAQVPPGANNLLPADTLIFRNEILKLPQTTLDIRSVTGYPFLHAYHLSTFAGNIKGLTLRCTVNEQVNKGDVMLLSFYTRSLKSVKETGESFMEISLDRNVNGKYEWPPLLERGMSFGSDWILTQIPFTASRDVLQGDLSLVIKLSDFPQEIEIGGLSLHNYKNTVQMSSLPKSIVHYEGDAPEAPWRKAAKESIEKFRKGNLQIQVIDKHGRPINGAEVSIRMTRSAFGFGTAVNSQLLLDTSKEAVTYRDTLKRYFNKVVFENELKSKNWATADHQKTLMAIQWLKSNSFNIRGHVMVWPSFQHSPHLLRYQNDTAGLRAAIMRDIADETRVMHGQFDEWDIVNEPVAHRDFLKKLGRGVMVDWFNAARRLAPGVKLFVNDYTMFHGEGENSDSEKFYDNVKFLLDKKAPIDCIGEQAHIGGTPPGIDYVIARLDHFARLGLPIQISEFDITSDDDDFKAHYLRDFMTAVFSHPATIGIMQWGFWAGAHWIPAAALWDKNWARRENGNVYTEFVSKTWSTNVTAKTSAGGNYRIRAFNGKYDITVRMGNKRKLIKTSLNSKGKKLFVAL